MVKDVFLSLNILASKSVEFVISGKDLSLWVLLCSNALVLCNTLFQGFTKASFSVLTNLESIAPLKIC